VPKTAPHLHFVLSFAQVVGQYLVADPHGHQRQIVAATVPLDVLDYGRVDGAQRIVKDYLLGAGAITQEHPARPRTINPKSP
jgi:hypothetical protein